MIRHYINPGVHIGSYRVDKGIMVADPRNPSRKIPRLELIRRLHRKRQERVYVSDGQDGSDGQDVTDDFVVEDELPRKMSVDELVRREDEE